MFMKRQECYVFAFILIKSCLQKHDLVTSWSNLFRMFGAGVCEPGAGRGICVSTVQEIMILK